MRQELDKQISLEDFNGHYWLRLELIKKKKKEVELYFKPI